MSRKPRSIISPNPGEAPPSVDELADDLDVTMADLLAHARQGDAKAIRALAVRLNHASESLLGLRAQKGALKAVARELAAWPVPLSRNQASRRRVEGFVLKELELGAAWQELLSGKAMGSVEARIANRIRDRLAEYVRGGFSGPEVDAAKELIRQRRLAGKDWWPLAKVVFEEWHGIAFQDIRKADPNPPPIEPGHPRLLSEVERIEQARRNFECWEGRKFDGGTYSFKTPGRMRAAITKEVRSAFIKLWDRFMAGVSRGLFAPK